MARTDVCYNVPGSLLIASFSWPQATFYKCMEVQCFVVQRRKCLHTAEGKKRDMN